MSYFAAHLTDQGAVSPQNVKKIYQKWNEMILKNPCLKGISKSDLLIVFKWVENKFRKMGVHFFSS